LSDVFVDLTDGGLQFVEFIRKVTPQIVSSGTIRCCQHQLQSFGERSLPLHKDVDLILKTDMIGAFNPVGRHLHAFDIGG
jgi:hypothetical protein